MQRCISIPIRMLCTWRPSSMGRDEEKKMFWLWNQKKLLFFALYTEIKAQMKYTHSPAHLRVLQFHLHSACNVVTAVSSVRHQPSKKIKKKWENVGKTSNGNDNKKKKRFVSVCVCTFSFPRIGWTMRNPSFPGLALGFTSNWEF